MLTDIKGKKIVWLGIDEKSNHDQLQVFSTNNNNSFLNTTGSLCQLYFDKFLRLAINKMKRVLAILSSFISEI